ncbi:ArsR/SmtB family transcription factor [Flexivirga meconopsidis]|uniref:ArsR/SmtB family transcription factor n=1 Tax=Flexivirga meconopsidis TaxID=2977121 RepID=UPI00223FACE4|nr:DUF5937 family protein [Flexivirga meconopsidis]
MLNAPDFTDNDSGQPERCDSECMLRIEVSVDGLAGVRFTVDPLAEAVSSLAAVLSGDPRPVHGRLVGLLQGVELRERALLQEVFQDPAWVPDFVTSEPLPTEDTEEQLARVGRADLAEVAADLARMRAASPDLDACRLTPRELRNRTADALLDYWGLVLRPFADRLQTIGTADIAHRAALGATEGLAAALGALHGCIEFADGALLFPKLGVTATVRATDGVWLVPSVFRWPGINVRFDGNRPVVHYPARGAGRVWEAPREADPALARLIGRNRARVLMHLQLPCTTTQLAVDLGLAKATVSEHLGALADARMVTPRRVGREVLYDRTELGDQLTAAG